MQHYVQYYFATKNYIIYTVQYVFLSFAITTRVGKLLDISAPDVFSTTFDQ